MTNTQQPKNRENPEQDQFLTILSREEALARFEAALFPRAVPAEQRPLADALGCALAEDVVAPIDVPPFDRSNVDGFAVRSADLASSGEATPARLMLNAEVIACGIAQVSVARRPRVAVMSTGDELVQPGHLLRPAEIYDTNGAIVTAAVSENGGEAVFLGAIADNEAKLEAAMRAALDSSDMLVLSGGTSKGAGDLSHRIIARLGQPGIIAHGVALKPG